MSTQYFNDGTTAPPLLPSHLPLLRGLSDVSRDGEVESAHANRSGDHATLHATPIDAAGHHVHWRGAVDLRQQHRRSADDGGELQRTGGVAE